MKIVVCFLAFVFCTAALPVDLPFEALEELDPTKKLYVTPVSPVKAIDLPSSRIIGGTELAPGAAPYQVAIIADGNIFYSGSLISTIRVLTVAIYTSTASYVEVRLGAHKLNQDEDTQVRLTSSNIIVHENYTNYGLENDIAVIFLPSAVPLTDYIRVVPLAPADAESYAGSRGLLAGWGYTTDSSIVVADALRGVYLDVITVEECRSFYGDVVLDSHLCTSGSGIIGGCFYDNGSPLVIREVQVGIAAYFSVKCEHENPTGFTRISSFRSWITQNAGV